MITPPFPSLALPVPPTGLELIRSISRLLLRSDSSIPNYRLGSYLDFPLYLVLGYLSGAISFFFTETVDIATQFTRSVRFPRPLLPILGGIAMGLVASAVPEVTYEGFENFNRVLRGDSGIAALVSMRDPILPNNIPRP